MAITPITSTDTITAAKINEIILATGVSSVNGLTGAVTIPAGVSSVNGQTGAVTVSGGVTSVNGQTGAVTVSTTDASKLPLAGGTMTGNMTFSNAALYITHYDTDWGYNRYIHSNGGTMGFLKSDGNWGMYNDNAGNTISIGDVASHSGGHYLSQKANTSALANYMTVGSGLPSAVGNVVGAHVLIFERYSVPTYAAGSSYALTGSAGGFGMNGTWLCLSRCGLQDNDGGNDSYHYYHLFRKTA